MAGDAQGGCTWPCLQGCCERMGKLRLRVAVWRGLVKQKRNDEAQRELLGILNELGRAADAGDQRNEAR